MQKLCENVSGFNALPKACLAVRDIATAVKKHLPRHERIVDKEIFSTARRLADEGIENVVFTMVAHYFRTEIPVSKSFVTTQRLTKEIRDHAKSHRVPLTDQINTYLDEIDGDKDAAPEPPAPSGASEQASVPPSVPPASAAPQPASAPPAKRRRFADVSFE